MKLSYIVPVYNVEKYIRECVDSILAQTFDDYEIILVDDESPDGCPRICDEYAEKYPNVIKVIHKQNAGPASARNDGMKIAQGEYIWFFDSDDYLSDDRVNEVYNKAKELDVDILQMSFLSFRDGKQDFYSTDSAFGFNKVYSHDEIVKYVAKSSSDRSVIFAWRNIYKREFLLANDIRFDASLRMLEDPPFNTLAFLKAERLVAVDIPVYTYRIRQNSLQRQKYIEDYDLIMEYQWKLKLRYFSENSDNDAEFYRDIAEFTIKTNLPSLLFNVYHADNVNKFQILKRIGESEMLRTSFRDYDINDFKSKSLDWWATKFIKERKYALAHLLCKNVLFK